MDKYLTPCAWMLVTFAGGYLGFHLMFSWFQTSSEIAFVASVMGGFVIMFAVLLFKVLVTRIDGED